MPDVWMLWYSHGRPRAGLHLDGLSELCRELGFLEPPAQRGAKAGAFNQACQVRHVYSDSGGQVHTISAVIEKVATEFIMAAILREDGFKIGEYKFFHAVARKRTGVVRGTTVVKARLRSVLEREEREAGRVWADLADAVFNTTALELPNHVVRRCVRATMDEIAWPVPSRQCSHFLYEDELEMAERLRRFLEKTTKVSDVRIIGVDDGDHAMPASAADAHLCALVMELNERLRVLRAEDVEFEQVRGRLTFIKDRYRRHQRRLERPLPMTKAQIALADRMIVDLVRGSSLPTDIHR